MNYKKLKSAVNKIHAVEKNKGETTLAYVLRVVSVMTFYFVFIMIPVLVLFAKIEGEPIVDYLLRYGVPSFIGLFVIGPFVVSHKLERLKQKKEIKIDL